ncbi:MAG: cysteine desulfurase CsdA [Thalassobius sp.]|nr:cysteine desulfurase CsdA [Thalassovita sp.]
MPFDAQAIKKQFPLFNKFPDLVYLDSAATAQKPQSMIDAVSAFYSFENSNIHRGVYDLSAQATQKYEGVRKQLHQFLGGDSANCFTFCAGTTDAINMVAEGYLADQLEEGDKVIITEMEHHANLIPWQQICKKKKALLVVIPIDENGELDISQLENLLDNSTKLLAITHISNTLGTINPIKEITELAHQYDVPVLIDGAQSVGHCSVNITEIGADFLVFSGHKMFGPTGIGVLYCAEKFHDQIKPTKFGGGNITEVSFEETSWMKYPHGMEAGTRNIAGVIGLGAALDFVEQLDLQETFVHEQNLAALLRKEIGEMDGVEVVGSPKHFAGIVSFQVEDVHPHDVASFLSDAKIAVRAGHHCTQPLLNGMDIPATVRASFSIYNTEADVTRLVNALVELKKFWM